VKAHTLSSAVKEWSLSHNSFESVESFRSPGSVWGRGRDKLFLPANNKYFPPTFTTFFTEKKQVKDRQGNWKKRVEAKYSGDKTAGSSLYLITKTRW